METLAVALQLQSVDDWHTVTKPHIIAHGGKMLLSKYHDSMYELLRNIFPQHTWHEWRLGGSWGNMNIQRKFMEWLGTRLGIKKMDDWYELTTEKICDNGGKTLLEGYYHGSPSQLLQTIYPNFPWQLWRFSNVPKGYWLSVKNQRNFM